MKRHMGSLVALGLFAGVTFLSTTEARACQRCGGGRGGRTYHYNGSYGYYSGGPATYGAPAPYAQPAGYYPQPAVHYAPQPTYAVPQAPAGAPGTLFRTRPAVQSPAAPTQNVF